MRIAILTWESLHSISVGGVAVHTTELAAALERKGHEVHVFTRMRWEGDWQYDKIHGVHYHRVPYRGSNDFIDDINQMCLPLWIRCFTPKIIWVRTLILFTRMTGCHPMPWCG